jgi:hypothetical protein
MFEKKKHHTSLGLWEKRRIEQAQCLTLVCGNPHIRFSHVMNLMIMFNHSFFIKKDMTSEEINNN